MEKFWPLFLQIYVFFLLQLLLSFWGPNNGPNTKEHPCSPPWCQLPRSDTSCHAAVRDTDSFTCREAQPGTCSFQMPVLLALSGHPSLLGLPVGSPPWPSGRLSPGLWQRLLRGACLLPAASLGAFLLTVVPPAVHRVFPILCISFFSLKKKNILFIYF